MFGSGGDMTSMLIMAMVLGGLTPRTP
jgi:hypothetical protein